MDEAFSNLILIKSTAIPCSLALTTYKGVQFQWILIHYIKGYNDFHKNNSSFESNKTFTTDIQYDKVNPSFQEKSLPHQKAEIVLIT